VTGILAANAFTAFKEKKGTFPVSRPTLDLAQSAARNLFLVTALLGVATAATASLAGYLTFRTPQSNTTLTIGLPGIFIAGAI
jgi:hypothetical protein